MLNSGLSSSLWLFSQHYVQAYQKKLNHLPLVEIDQQWPSPCIVSQFDQQLNAWQPQKVDVSLSFTNVEQALNVELHPDICQYYTTLFSESMPANCEHGELSLLFAWSEDDFNRLQENIIGHVLMKQKLKQKITVFFAVTDDDNFILSIDNTNGSIWVERIGCEPHKKLADSLNQFIQQLTPFIYVSD